MTNKFGLPLLICFSAFLVGCNSLDWHANDEYRIHGKKPRVYPGVSADCGGLAEAHSTGMHAPFIYVYSTVDMPFSLIVDTLYLPADIVAVTRQKHRDLEYSRTNELNKVVHSASPDTAPEPTATAP